MAIEISVLRDDERDLVRSLAGDVALSGEFDVLAERAYLDHKLTDALCARDCTLVARVHGEPAGFTITFVLPRAEGGAWAAVRVGVAGRFQRRGIGSALLAEVRARLARRDIPGGLREMAMSAWRPNDAAAAFAAGHGYTHVRCFWKMDRPAAACPEPAWPAGVTVRVFDGSERALADWNDAYNDSFAEHYRYVPATLELARSLAAAADFLGDGLALAYRDGRCVGFCRNEWVGKEGEIGVLGVTRAARGIGLGRALLRWGVRYFEGLGEKHVALRVDGENETALSLYRSEGFAVTRTRDLWAIVSDAAAEGTLSARGTRSAGGPTP
jgi:mycothiol synthase